MKNNVKINEAKQNSQNTEKDQAIASKNNYFELVKEIFLNWKTGNTSKHDQLLIEEIDSIFQTNDYLKFDEMMKFWYNGEERISFRLIVNNMRNYKGALKFGFDEIIFDDFGYLKNDNWQNEEEIIFKSDKSYFTNKIKVAKGNNNKWTYGIYWGGAFEGGAFGYFYDIVADSKEKALELGLKDMLFRNKKCVQNEATKDINKQIEYRITQITKLNLKDNQLLLF